MNRQIMIMNFSGIYQIEQFYREYPYHFIDCTDIVGTNCYCDEEAYKRIEERIRPYSPEGIHFIDSGNYHYISELWMSKIRTPFLLILLDHHTDMQQSAFGELTSCGGWVLELLQRTPFLQKVILAGPKLEERWENEKIVAIEEEKLSYITILKEINKQREKMPIYLSIDKDIISANEVRTNWDQGNVRARELEAIVSELIKEQDVIGIDICGEYANVPDLFEKITYVKENNAFNKSILQAVEEIEA